MATLTYQQVRDFLADSPENNHLIDDVEFTDSRIDLAMNMAVDSYNAIPPILLTKTLKNINNAVLLYGTLWHLFIGQAGLAARNQMSYSDGGLTIPIEERYEFYTRLAQMYEQMFKQQAKEVKISQNMESGWGEVITDYASMPIW